MAIPSITAATPVVLEVGTDPITLPSGNVGDYLILLWAHSGDNDAAHTITGWTSKSFLANLCHIYYRQRDGSETTLVLPANGSQGTATILNVQDCPDPSIWVVDIASTTSTSYPNLATVTLHSSSLRVGMFVVALGYSDHESRTPPTGWTEWTDLDYTGKTQFASYQSTQVVSKNCSRGKDIGGQPASSTYANSRARAAVSLVLPGPQDRRHTIIVEG